MQIVAGKYKGKRLHYGGDVRATSEKVRAAIFDIIGDRILDASFLDLCAGTGAMGIEALSRGAKRAVFVDVDVRLLKENFAALKLQSPEAEIWRGSADRCIRRLSQTPFDFIFLDPPWTHSTLYKDVLKGISQSDILSAHGFGIVEAYKKFDLSLPKELALQSTYRYGDTQVIIFT